MYIQKDLIPSYTHKHCTKTSPSDLFSCVSSQPSFENLMITLLRFMFHQNLKLTISQFLINKQSYLYNN